MRVGTRDLLGVLFYLLLGLDFKSTYAGRIRLILEQALMVI